MKRSMYAIMMLVALVLMIASGVVYSQGKVVVKEQVTVTIDREVVRMDVPPVNLQGHTLVPVRSVFSAFGADIGWFPREERVYIHEGCTVIWLQIGDAHAKVNDDIVPMDVPAVLYRGRTMVPLRFIAESLGADVQWNPETSTITIITREQASTTPEEN